MRRFVPDWRGTWRDLVMRALHQRATLNAGLPANRQLSLQQCIDLERFVYEADCIDQLDPASVVRNTCR